MGNAGAILLGAPVTTIDIDLFVRKTPVNIKKLLDCLREIGFSRVNASKLAQEDVVEFEQPGLKVDIVFAPLGIRSFASARSRREEVEVEGVRIPVASLEDIIASKEAADRAKDRQALPVLRAALEMRRMQNESDGEGAL